MKTVFQMIGMLALVAAAIPATAVPARCEPGTWLADPGIAPWVLEANGYRVVTRQTRSLDDGRQAIETIVANDARRAKCRAIYGEDGALAETVCYLPCDDGDGGAAGVRQPEDLATLGLRGKRQAQTGNRAAKFWVQQRMALA